MKRIILIFLIFVSFNLFSQERIGEIIWEYRNFPEENILEIRFTSTIPLRYLYNELNTNNNMLEGYKEARFENTSMPRTSTGTFDNWIIRITYPNRTNYAFGTYPETALMNYLGFVEYSTVRTNPELMEFFIDNFNYNRPGNWFFIEGFSFNDEELYWKGFDMSRGHRSFIAPYIVYRND